MDTNVLQIPEVEFPPEADRVRHVERASAESREATDIFRSDEVCE